MINCCRNCVPPRRHAGCHSTCPDYTKEKRIHEEQKAKRDEEHRILTGIDDNKFKQIHRAVKRRRDI